MSTCRERRADDANEETRTLVADEYNGDMVRGNVQPGIVMKITKTAILVLAIAVVLYILLPGLAWTQNGAALYNAKCSALQTWA